MASKSWNSVVTLVCLTFLLFCCSSANSSFFYDEYGVVRPSDPRPFVGENLTLFCNLTKVELTENSTRLYFTRAGDRVPPEYVDILSSRSIRLRYPITKPEDEGLFVCWLSLLTGDRITVGTQYVEADYRPAMVKNVSCEVENWKNMTCTWDLGRDYQHEDKVKVSLVWAISGIQRDCPNLIGKTGCFWSDSPETHTSKIFLPDSEYIMAVLVTNTVRDVTVKSQPPIKVDTRRLVKPDPAQWVRVEEKNATCIKLVWNHSEKVRNKLAVVEYFSEWNVGNWTSLPVQRFVSGDVHTTICGLTPFTEHTVRIGIQPEGHDGQFTGFRSDWVYKEVERTDPSVPDVGPEICAGCYTDLPSTADQRKVIIYWKHIPPEIRYSFIRGYHVHVPDIDVNMTSSCNLTEANQTSCLLALQTDKAYDLQLSAVTSQNKLSRNYSSIAIPALDKVPSVPSSFVVEVDRPWNGTLYLRWTGQQNTHNYLLVWCTGSRTTLMCASEPKWTADLPSDTTHYSLNVKGDRPENYLVGIVRRVKHDGAVVSSGIEWAKCLYIRGEVPPPPKNVDFAVVPTPGSLSVQWDRPVCTNSEAYVDQYLVYYCKTDHNNKCTDAESKVSVPQDKTGVKLDNLEPKAVYRVRVSAMAPGREGQKSDPKFAEVTELKHAEASTDNTLIVVIPVCLVVLVLFVICVCRVRRHLITSREKFASLGNLPPLPKPPSFSDREASNFKNRPLPTIPGQTSGSNNDNKAYDSDLTHSGTNSTNHRTRNGSKHKSITSETSLLGQEDSFCDTDDSRRRHRSGGTGSTSERTKLLAEEGKMPTSDEGHTVSKYDSDSGAESRCSSDHDYASVDSGGASGSERSDGSEQKGLGLQSTHAALQQLGPTSGQGSHLPKDDPHGASSAAFVGGRPGDGCLPKDGFQAAQAASGESERSKAKQAQKSYHPHKQKGYLPNGTSSNPPQKGITKAAPTQPGYTKVIPPQHGSQDNARVAFVMPVQGSHTQRNGGIAVSFEFENPPLTTFGKSSSGYKPHPKEASGRSSRAVSTTPYEPAKSSYVYDDATLLIRPVGSVKMSTNPVGKSGNIQETDFGSLDRGNGSGYLHKADFGSLPSVSMNTNPRGRPGYVHEKDVHSLSASSASNPGAKSVQDPALAASTLANSAQNPAFAPQFAPTSSYCEHSSMPVANVCGTQAFATDNALRSQTNSEPATLPMVNMHPPMPKGYTPHSAFSMDSSAGNKGVNSTDQSEPIYSPPWESDKLFTIINRQGDNRPLSGYMHELPRTYFAKELPREGAPTTDL